MKITICGSTVFILEMEAVKKQLEILGLKPIVINGNLKLVI